MADLSTSRVSELVIQALAAENAELRERLDNVQDDVVTYREVTQQAIHALHDITEAQARLRQQHERLIEEYRRLREQIIRSVAA